MEFERVFLETAHSRGLAWPVDRRRTQVSASPEPHGLGLKFRLSAWIPLHRCWEPYSIVLDVKSIQHNVLHTQNRGCMVHYAGCFGGQGILEIQNILHPKSPATCPGRAEFEAALVFGVFLYQKFTRNRDRVAAAALLGAPKQRPHKPKHLTF